MAISPPLSLENGDTKPTNQSGLIKIYNKNNQPCWVNDAGTENTFANGVHTHTQVTQVGNGTNKLTVFNNGNASVGTSVDFARLLVEDANKTLASDYFTMVMLATSPEIDSGGSLGLGGRYNSLGSLTCYGSIAGRKKNNVLGDYGGYLAFATRESGSGSQVERMRIQSNGGICIGAVSTLTCFQVVSATCNGTSWTPASDERLKRDITPMTGYGLSTVMQLKPVTYYFTADAANHREVGFIAQEVQKIIPEVVFGTEGDLSKGESLGLSYDNMVAVLTKAIQEQQAQIDELRKTVEMLVNQ
jgi:hypothetical protein